MILERLEHSFIELKGAYEKKKGVKIRWGFQEVYHLVSNVVRRIRIKRQ